MGWAKFKDNVLQGIELEIIRFKEDAELFNTPGPTPLMWSREGTSFDVTYFRSYLLFGEVSNELFAGPSASFGFSEDKLVPNISSAIRFDEKCYCFGLGGKLDYLLEINKKLYLTASTKVMLLDFGIAKEQVYDPTLPESQQKSSSFDVDFLRNRFSIMLGLGI